MIRKTILLIFGFLFIYFSAAAYANDVTLNCAQVSVSIGDKDYAVTDASPKICGKDYSNNMKDRLFSTGIFSVDKENNSLVMLGEFLGVILWYVIALTLGLYALYWLIESARQENENAIRNLIITLAAIIASAIIAYQPISMAISNYAYRTFIASANYSFRESINNQEMLTLAPKIDTTDNVVNANVFANRLIQVALRNEFTERYISQAAYGKLDNDYDSDCILICSRNEISVTEYFKRVYSCNKIQPFYLVETMNNTENSLLDWSRTQQNTEIQFNHIEECADNYKYQKEIYGHAYSNAKILYPALNPIGKSYANSDIIDNLPSVVQMLNKVVDTAEGTVKSQYGGYKGTTESERMSMVNSGYVADYNKVKPTAAVQAAADYMLKCATDLIDENSGSSIWTTTLKDIPGAEPTLGLQAINKCRDSLLGSSRTSKTEILPIYEDALKAANEILKLKCNLPTESLTRQTAIINSNGEVPYMNSYATKATNAFTSLQTSCISINENGIFPTTSYTEEERETSFKIVQEMKIAITGWVMTVYDARNLAVGMFYERYKSKFMASQFSEYGYTFQSLQFLESLKASDGTSLLEANSTIIPEIVIEGDLDFNTASSYLNEKIVAAKKGTEESNQAISDERINLSDYLDNGIATIQKSKYKIIDQTMPKNTQGDMNMIKQKIREIIFSVATTKLNIGLGFDYAGNLLDLVEKCKASSGIDCSNHKQNLGHAVLGNFEMAKLNFTIGVSLKIVEKLGSEALGKSNEVVGSITGSSSFAALTNIMAALPKYVILGILAALGILGTYLLWVSGLQALITVVFYGLAIKIFTTAAEMLIKCFVLPFILIVRIIMSGLFFNLDVFKFLVVESVLLVVKGYILGKYIILISEFYSTFITILISSLFEIVSNTRANDGFFISLAVDASVFPIASAMQVVCVLFAAYTVALILKSLMQISDFKFGKNHDNGLAAAALLAVNANTVNRSADKVAGAIKTAKGIK